MARRPPVGPAGLGDDLFSIDPDSYISFGLAARSWPEQSRFPINIGKTHVADMVREDLLASERPLLVAGYSSIASLIDLVSGWRLNRSQRPGTMRLLLGSEPFPSRRPHFASAREEFTEEVRAYWLDQSVSVRLSAKVIRTIEALDEGALQARVIPGPPALHAKIYLGADAATVGSSNFTDYGMLHQLEANARFEKANDAQRFTELVTVGENLWSQGVPWQEELRRLLLDLLQVVSWQEALARACAELLEGDWLGQGLDHQERRAQLWPSQKAGIAQALWIVENLGSVLVADATGSGKTRMGAHLVAAVRDRLLDTGRMRRDRDLTTLVCPPSVQETWRNEALISGVTIMPVSQGLLSRRDPTGPRIEEAAVSRAQVLAVDEAHNFLTAQSNRTRQIRDTLADHVLLFTATPISRGAQDLLSLVGLLGADNFDDETLEVLERLDRGARMDEALTDRQRQRLREEIQRFTVRRTKTALNDLVARDEAAYADSATGRTCRYPEHHPKTYATGETAEDERLAERIRAVTDDLLGVVQLGRHVRVPETLRNDVTDEQWLRTRLTAAKGLARHNILAAMRSSKAALIEHVAGTKQAISVCGLPAAAKTQLTGDVLSKARALAEEGLPELQLTCPLPLWLEDAEAWQLACEQEAARYQEILSLGEVLSAARERTKAQLLQRLADDDRLVLAFDRHPITLAAVAQHLDGRDIEVLIASGDAGRARKRVEQLFARDSTARAIALCSDALNEGLNLQGAAALAHLDLPTTLRVAEQRVGRVDRMDSPHEHISVWWPEDGAAFATRQIELLLSRRHASESLLGSNLPMPVFARHATEEQIVPVHEQIRELEGSDLAWDGIHDALDPVRRLVEGETAVIPAAVYAEHRHTRQRVMARVAPVASPKPWAFLALSGTQHGAPRWLLLEGEAHHPTAGVERVTERLRTLLNDNPPNVPFDETCEMWLDRFLNASSHHERLLLPRRMQRALDQMSQLTATWSDAADRAGQSLIAEQWRRVHRIARPQQEDERLDPYLVGEVWWDLVRPHFAHLERTRRRRRYQRLRDLDPYLRTSPLDITLVQSALRRVPIVEAVDKRVSAVILGVPVPEMA